MHVRVGLSGPAIERAKRADDVTHIRVIDVAVDDVCDDIARVFSLADLVCGKPNADKIFRFEQDRAIVGSQTFTTQCLVQNRLNIFAHCVILVPSSNKPE